MQTLKLTKKYEKYPEYKDSGVEWLGMIPKDWNIDIIQHLFTKVKRAGFENEELLSVYRDHGVVIKSSRDDNHNKASEDLSSYQLVNVGDLAINKMKAWQGSIAVSEYKGIVSPAYFICKPLTKNDSRFLHYLLRSDVYIKQYERNSGGVRNDQWDLNYERFRKLEIAIPKLNEQEKISKYLDEKLPLLDQIMRRKERQIELVRERKTAVINHAITKGIKTTTSNNGWRKTKLKFIGKAIIGLTYSPEELTGENGMLVLRSSNVQKDLIYLEDNVYVSKKIPYELITRQGDILICSRNGSRSLIGKNAIIDEKSEGLTFGAFMTVFRTKNNEFIAYFLKSNVFMSQLSSTLTSTINQLTTHFLNNIEVSLPTEQQQQEIVKYLNEKLINYDEAIKKIETSIDKLKEFKSSLISNVVTGKIKV